MSWKRSKPIEAYTCDLDYSAYQANGLVQAAVERKFEIIGEALNRIYRTDPAILEQISEYQRIISFRNILAHGYDVIDHEIVWDAIQQHVPKLKTEPERLLM